MNVSKLKTKLVDPSSPVGPTTDKVGLVAVKLNNVIGTLNKFIGNFNDLLDELDQLSATVTAVVPTFETPLVLAPVAPLVEETPLVASENAPTSEETALVTESTVEESSTESTPRKKGKKGASS